jgi:hypothetical protein
MPLFGQLTLADHLKGAAPVAKLAVTADEFAVERCQVLAFTHEIDISEGFKVTPKALHPSIPSYCQVVFRQHPDGPAGAFTIAEMRVNARAGTHYLGYVTRSFTDNARAAELFRQRYGAPMTFANVRLQRTYYGVRGSVALDGEVLFDALLERPHYISGSDVLYTPNLNLAFVDGQPKLVLQEMEYTIGKAERGKAVIQRFDAGAFGDERVKLRQALPATVTESLVRYTSVRFLIDPERPAISGTETLAAA